MSVGYLETRLVGNYIQMWQTSERRTPPPLIPLPLLFGMLNEISPICGGNSVAHPSQNMSVLFPSPLPAPPPIAPPPPTHTHLCPVSSPKADEGGNGPKWCSWEWVDYYRRSQFTSGFPNKRDVIAATIHLWRRENIRFGGEEEKSRALNQTQTGLRRGVGGRTGRRRLFPPRRSLPLAYGRHPSPCPAVAGGCGAWVRRPLLSRHKANGWWQKSGAEDPKKDFADSISSRQLTLSSTPFQLRGC